MNKKFNFIDLFSGAGGLSCGLEMAGFNCLLGVDFDKFAMQTFAKNHKHAKTYCGNIKDLHLKKINDLISSKKIHMIVGGPPCQGFSTVGKGNPKDQRNVLFMEFCRIVKQLSPDFVVMENVTGLVAKKNEKTLLLIFKIFSNMGYQLDVKILCAHHYGVPENRKRTIIIGSKITDKIEFPKASNLLTPVTVGETFKALYRHKNLINHDEKSSQISSLLDQKRIKHIPEGKSIRYEEDEEKYLKGNLKLNIDWDKLPENRLRQAKYQRLNSKLPSPTIMTHRHNYFHPTKDRYLTPREAASLQSFPFDFEFIGPVSSQWRQIGNAVPPLLAKAIGKAILKMYKNKKNLVEKNKTQKVQDKVESIRKNAFIYREQTLQSN